jgi:hypothetical protein
MRLIKEIIVLALFWLAVACMLTKLVTHLTAPESIEVKVMKDYLKKTSLR